MKLITEPTVYAVGRQEVDEDTLDRFLGDHGVSWESDSEVGAEVLVETAGRLCYMSYAKPRPGGNRAYIEHIKEVGHGSVAEAAVWNLIVVGVSRALSHELIRHRAGVSPSQLSQRYVDESVAEYVVPPDLQVEVRAYQVSQRMISGELSISGHATWYDFMEKNGLPRFNVEEFHSAADAGADWSHAVEFVHKKYIRLSDYLSRKASAERPDLAKTDARKYARQAARSVLPNATETKLFLTVNARAARHFIEMRASRFADPEIRVLANKVYEVLQAESPALFGDYRRERLPDGTFELTTPYRKI